MNRETTGTNGSPEGDDVGPSRAERFLMVASTAFAVLLFAYVIWQGATTPTDAVPTADVVGTDTLPNDDVRVTVAFRNAQDVGLVIATVDVECDTPPPELTFENVPADDSRIGHAICPPGTGRPDVAVSTWIEA